MTNEVIARKVAEGLAEHEAMLATFNGTPILCVGVAHAPHPNSGKWVLSMAGGLPIEDAYRIITAIQEEIAARLGVL